MNDNLTPEIQNALQELNNNILNEFKSIKIMNKKPKMIFFLILSIICFIYAFMLILISIIMMVDSPYNEEITEKNSKEFIATIAKIQPIPYHIKLEEHNALLRIYYEAVVVDMDALSELKVGQTITFRIKNKDISKMGSLSESIEIVELKSNGNDIITLKSYQMVEYDSAPYFIFIIIGGVFLSVAIMFLHRYRTHKKRMLI